MRAIMIACLALALFVASAVADMQYYAAQSQDDVKNLRWTNCSSVIHGRLGDLHKYDDEAWHMVRQNDDYFFAYSPCKPMFFDALITVGEGGLNYGWQNVDLGSLRPANTIVDGKEVKPAFFWVLLQKITREGRTDLYSSFQTANANDFTSIHQKYVTFHMPEAKGEVPHFTAEYDIVKSLVKTNAVPQLSSNITITVSCGGDASDFHVNATTATASPFIFMQSKEACARFPYTNSALPAGGVAALVVFIVISVIQFSICGWYHATHKLDVNPADRGYDAVE